MPSGGEQHQIIECVVPADTCFIGTPVNEASNWGVQTVEMVLPIPHWPFWLFPQVKTLPSLLRVVFKQILLKNISTYGFYKDELKNQPESYNMIITNSHINNSEVQ